MEKKMAQLLKELLLTRECGAYETLDKEISLAIDIYSNMVNLTREELIEILNNIYQLVWADYWSDLKSWDKRQEQYKLLLNQI